MVLIVDDDAHLGSMLSDLIRTLGHEPSWVSDGAAALRALARGAFDYVVKPVDVRQLAQVIDLALLMDSDAGG